ncbi:MAG: class I SAM-dependent RNA methyltransferase [Verrucomicrobiaceae bacterium]|nr:class I SAM-dependent RNA methyltransferase [Verrucomicrobiaceae bacterium]
MLLNATIPLPQGCVKACRSCRHRQWTEEASHTQKMEFLQKTLAPWVDRLSPIQGPASDRRWGYREKVKLSARCYDGRWEFGMEPVGDFVPLPDCPVQSQRVNEAFALLKPHLPGMALRYIVQNGSLITLIIKDKALPPTHWITDSLTQGLRALGIEGLHANLHPASGRILFAEKGWRCLWGKARVQDSRGLWHGPGSFSQLIPELHEDSLVHADQFLAPTERDAVVDLYSGIGASLRRWKRAIGVEFDGEAVACAQLNAPHAQILRGPCNQRLPQVRNWLSEQKPSAIQTYINPPRSGLEPGVLNWLANEPAVDRIAYLSCSAGTLGRDLAVLEAAGYQVERLLPFDFFPQTHHVEVLAQIRRKEHA